MVPVLLARGVPTAQVARLTDVPVALVELIAAEPHPTPPAYWSWCDALGADIAQTPTHAPMPAANAATVARPTSAAAASRFRRAIICIVVISVLSAAAALASIATHRPELAAAAFAGSTLVPPDQRARPPNPPKETEETAAPVTDQEPDNSQTKPHP